MNLNSESEELMLKLAELSEVPKKNRKLYVKTLKRLFELNSNLDPHPKQIFVIGPNKRLGNKIARLLKTKPTPFSVKCFEDGEVLPHQLETVTEQDVYIIFTAQKGKLIDKWKNIYLQFVRNVKWGRPYRITVILPELYGQRADVEDFKNREAKMSNLFPDLLGKAGADRIITCKLHNPASATDEPQMINIDTTVLILKQIRSQFSDLSKIVIASADVSGAKYARIIADELGVPVIITDKQRNKKSGVTKAMNIYDDGNISSDMNTIIFVDDLIQTFGSLKKASNAVYKKFSHFTNFIAAVTHPDFVKSTLGNIRSSRFRSIWVADTIPVSSSFIKKMEGMKKRIVIMSVAKLIARVIDNLHNNKPTSNLWTDTNGHDC